MAKGQDIPAESRKRLEKSFKRMMSALFREEAASLRIELLEEPEVAGFIDEHARVLDASFAEVEMSDTMRAKLCESDYIFSGIKTFHELNEAFPSLLDEKGNRKPFNQFLNDVQKIDDTYNKAYLHAEYNHAQASAEMAAKWEGYEEDGDEYYLQYRTAGDDKVRPEHAALNGVTLPMSDPFWDEYFPPNGWNCRCTVVQVLKEKYPATDRTEAFRRGQEALAKDTKGIFHFNPGKQEKTFPDYNPYTISKCNSCTRKLNLSREILDNQLCDGCIFLRTNVCGYEEVPVKRGRVRQHKTQSPDEWEENRSIATYMAEKHGFEIDLLPKIDGKQGHKNPDSFNRTLGYNQEYKDNTGNTYNSYDRAIRDGRKQASHLVIRLLNDADFDILTKAMHNRCKFSKECPVEDITLIQGDKDHTYTVAEIARQGFKARKEDLK